MHSLNPSSLRDAILQGLSNLPGSRELQVVVLVTTPRRHTGLFPYARPRPKVFVQDILILLFEQGKAIPEPGQSESNTRVCVGAIESFLYLLPSSSAILYVSKVDSTGLGMHPSPVRALVQSFLSYMADVRTRTASTVWIHVFARSQNQYLFPNSSQCPTKRVLRDAELCRWWQTIIEDVADGFSETNLFPHTLPNPIPSNRSVAAAGGTERAADPFTCYLFRILPGYSEPEADRLLPPRKVVRPPSSLPSRYGHPYSSPECPAPLATSPSQSIAFLIPTFSDDPKARFLTEIAATTEGSSVPFPKSAKRAKIAPLSPSSKGRAVSEGPAAPPSLQKPQGPSPEEKALREVSMDEFWERMGFRQECCSGAITGFFVAIFQSKSAAGGDGPVEIVGALPGQISAAVLARVTSTLLGLDFGAIDRAHRASNNLEQIVRTHCGRSAMEAAVPEEKDSLKVEAGESVPGSRASSIQPVETEADPFTSYMFGSITLSNPPLPPRAENAAKESAPAPVVNILQVKKKKRPAPS